ncbi:glycoside hydrolase family 2 TIM barrel-domain containing protein [Bacteroidota bacterium]
MLLFVEDGMLRNKLLILLIFVLIQGTNIHASITDYKTFSKAQLYELMPSTSRFVENLSGKWQISVDGNEWKNINIPYYIPENNEIVLKRALKIDKSILHRSYWHLYFLGLDDKVEVYLNDQFIGRYFGSMTPFMVKIPPKMIINETNNLMLKILPAEYGSRQIKEQNLYTKKIYTGTIREILLVGTPHIWVSDLKYKLKFNSDYSKCVVNSTVKVTSGIIDRMIDSYKNDSIFFDKNKVSVFAVPIIKKKSTGEIIAQGSQKQIDLQNERTVNLSFSLNVLNPDLWTVTKPELYQLTVKIMKSDLIIDELSTDLGFREIKTGTYKDKPVFAINGNVFPIKGVDYIEDYYHTGQRLSVWRMEKDISAIKTLGANLIRVKYGFPNPYFMKLCNKHGLFVMIELPVYDVPNALIGSDEIKVRMKNITEKIINAYGNDPSVFAWGIYEGVEENSPEVSEFENFILPFFKKYSDNPIYKAPLLSSDAVSIKKFDFIIPRLIGTNNDLDNIKNNLIRLKQQVKDKPIIFNYGMTVQPYNHNGYSDPMSVEAQANYIFNLFYLTKTLNLAGSMIWSFNDYELNNPLMILNNSNKFVSTSGLIDRYRQQRLSYSTMQSLFNNEKDPLFYAGSYSENAPVTFIVFGIIASLIIILLINRFKRFREYLFRSILKPYNFYADIRDQRIMSSIQTYVLGLVISITLGIFFSSICFFYKSSEVAQYIYLFLFPFSGLQDTFYTLIWYPEYLILVIALFFFIMIFIVSSIIKLSSVFVRAKIFFSDTYTITIWAGTPILLLLPLAMILNRLLVFSPGLMWLLLPLSIVILIWVTLRILKSVSVVFDIQSMKSYIIGFCSLLVFFIIILSIYQINLSVISYSQYLMNVLLKI